MPYLTKNGNTYYYVSRRLGGRVRSEYVGPAGSDVAELVRLARLESRRHRGQVREADAAFREGLEFSGGVLDGLCRRADDAAGRWLGRLGYRRVNRRWRRCRGA